MATCGMTLDLVAAICDQFAGYLGCCADPGHGAEQPGPVRRGGAQPAVAGRAVRARSRRPCRRCCRSSPTSQHLSDLLVADPESYDLLRLTEGQPVARRGAGRGHRPARSRRWSTSRRCCGRLRRFKHRETLRIAYGDIIREQSLETVTAQISYLADAILEAALPAAWQKLERSSGARRCGPDGAPARFVVLAMGKLGGVELNYSSDIDLIFLYDGDGKTDGQRPITNGEFFERLGRGTGAAADRADRAGLRLPRRPAAAARRRARADRRQRARRPCTTTTSAAAPGSGRRTSRPGPSAGDLALGEEFLEQLRPWIYRRYLSRADISGIKALKRRIEQRTHREGGRRAQREDRPRRHPRHRVRHPVPATAQRRRPARAADRQHPGGHRRSWRTCGCLSHQERSILEENYRFLRKIEHRLQIMFDLANAPLAQRARRAAEAGPADGLRRRARADRPGRASRPTTATRPI